MMAASSTTRRTGARPTGAITGWIEARANEFLESGLTSVKRVPYERALHASTTHRHDYLDAYVSDLGNVIDMEAIRGSKISLGVDPLGGAGVHYWAPIAERYGLNLTVVSDAVDPTFRFMTRRLGRSDPHGPVVALCDAAADRAEGSFRDCIRLRYGSRPARDRHAERGFAAAQSLSFRRHPLPVPKPAEVEHVSGSRQDRREQPDDRSRHRKAGPQALRGAGRLQVVRGWLARRFAWFWRRRERGRVFPP